MHRRAADRLGDAVEVVYCYDCLGVAEVAVDVAGGEGRAFSEALECPLDLLLAEASRCRHWVSTC